MAILLIVFGQGIAYYAISNTFALFNMKLQVPDIVFWLKNMPYFGLVPQLVGAAILGVYIFKSKFQDLSLVKKQLLRVSVLVLTVVMVAGCAFTAVPMVNAQMISTSGYYLQTPLPIASMYVGKYTNASWFCINGSNWQNFAQSPNWTLVESYALGNASSGTVWMDDTPFNYNLTVPANVSVTENLNGLSRIFCSVASSQGSPYTISVDNVTSGYYLAQDSANRYINSWSSTSAITTINAACNAGGEVKAVSGTFPLTGSTPLLIPSDDYFHGAGINDTIFKVQVGSSFVDIMQSTGVGTTDTHHITLSDFTIDGNYVTISGSGLHLQTSEAILTNLQILHVQSSDATYGAALRTNSLVSGSPCTLAEHIILKDGTKKGLFLAGPDQHWTDCIIAGFSYSSQAGLVITSSDNHFNGDHIYLNNNGVTTWSGSSRNEFIDCDIDNNNGTGVTFVTGTADNMFTGGWIRPNNGVQVSNAVVSNTFFHVNGYLSPSDQIGTASIIISQSGTNYSALNCTDDKVLITDTNVSRVFDATVGNDTSIFIRAGSYVALPGQDVLGMDVAMNLYNLTIWGEGRATILKSNVDIMNFMDCTNIEVRDLAVDTTDNTYAFANDGLDFDACNNTWVHNVAILNARDGGIKFDGGFGGRITDSDVFNTFGCGIGVWGNGYPVQVEGNYLRNTAENATATQTYAIHLSNVSNGIVSHNIILNGRGGIYVTGACSYNDIEQNNIQNQTDQGVYLEGGLDHYNTVVGNTMNKTYYGVRVSAGCVKNTIYPNTIANSIQGRYLDLSTSSILTDCNLALGITPSVSGWTTAPTNLAGVTDGDWNAGSTNGSKNSAAYDSNIGSLKIDLGMNYSGLVNIRLVVGNNATATINVEVQSSVDNSNWVDCNFGGTPSGTTYKLAVATVVTNATITIGPAFIYGQYVRLLFSNSATICLPSIAFLEISVMWQP